MLCGTTLRLSTTAFRPFAPSWRVMPSFEHSFSLLESSKFAGANELPTTWDALAFEMPARNPSPSLPGIIFVGKIPTARWRFQPLGKILVTLDNFPKYRCEYKKLIETTTWNREWYRLLNLNWLQFTATCVNSKQRKSVRWLNISHAGNDRFETGKSWEVMLRIRTNHAGL